MNHITLVYPRFFKWFPKSVSASHPSRWEELTADQFLAISNVKPGKRQEEKIIHIMTGLPRRAVRKLDVFHRYRLAQLLSFLSNPEPVNKFIFQRVDDLLAPKERLKGVTFEAFIHADTYFLDWHESQDDEYLNKMIAVFYRPEKNKKQLPFDADTVEDRAKRIASWDKKTRDCIALNYGMLRQWLCKSYPCVFPESSDGSEDKKKRKKKPAGSGWIGVYDSLVGDDIINSDAYAKKPLHEVLRYMNRKLKEGAKQ